ILAMPTIDFTHANVSGALSQAVSDGVLTPAQAAAINQRTGTYAEVLCGAGASPTGSDISALFFPPSN
ncbi:MAG: hypothetical protein KGL39_60260, partial [Patescibacteria group bacterium]|nr:hypothetical protein [Patescibacteria group bacterium]